MSCEEEDRDQAELRREEEQEEEESKKDSDLEGFIDDEPIDDYQGPAPYIEEMDSPRPIATGNGEGESSQGSLDSENEGNLEEAVRLNEEKQDKLEVEKEVEINEEITDEVVTESLEEQEEGVSVESIEEALEAEMEIQQEEGVPNVQDEKRKRSPEKEQKSEDLLPLECNPQTTGSNPHLEFQLKIPD